jgi:predicted permease
MLLFEVRAARRSLAKSKGFAVSVALTLGLGIGLTTAMFAAVDAWMLRPLPYAAEPQLFSLRETTASGHAAGVSKEDLRDLAGQAGSIEAAAALLPRTFGLGGSDRPEVVQAGMFTGDPFGVLGVSPLLGRAPAPEDELPGRTKLVWLSHATWRGRFGSDARLVGSTIRLNEEPYLVAGILPQGFAFPLQGKVSDLYIPLDGYAGRAVRSLLGIARLRNGVTAEAARGELRGVAARLASLSPTTNAGVGVILRPLREELLGDRGQSLLLLLGAVALLLLVTCANVGNLFLGRALARRRELAIRESLGASSARLLRQSFVEAALICGVGGLGGLAVAQAGMLLLQLLPQFVPAAAGIARLQTPQLTLAVIAFALLLSLAIAAAFAPLPVAIARRLDAQETLRHADAGGASGQRLRALLVGAEVALSVVLLVDCGLLLRSLENVVARDPGFDASGVVAFGIGLPEVRYSTDAKLFAFHEAALDRLAALPGTQSAGAVWGLPLAGKRPTVSFEIEGAPGAKHAAAVAVASAGYFETLRIPILEGRAFDATDGADRAPIVVVNRAFARAFFPGGQAAGKRILLGWNGSPARLHEIEGVAQDTPQERLDEGPAPQIYLPLAHDPVEGLHYVVRTSLDALAFAPLAREAIASIDSSLEKLEVRPLSFWQEAALTDRRAATSLLAFFAAAALGLSGLGIFAAVSYTVRRRWRELGIRSALGASPARILRHVAASGLRPVGLGLAIGLVTALWSAQLLRSQLFALSPHDPLTAAAVAGVVAAVALAACVAPGLRAAAVDPAVVLREE